MVTGLPSWRILTVLCRRVVSSSNSNVNRPFLVHQKPLFQTNLSMKISVYSHASLTHFHMNGYVLTRSQNTLDEVTELCLPRNRGLAANRQE